MTTHRNNKQFNVIIWLKEHPAVYLISAFAATVAGTYGVVHFSDQQIIDLDGVRIEQCKEANENILRQIDQQKQIKKLDSLVDGWKYFLAARNTFSRSLNTRTAGQAVNRATIQRLDNIVQQLISDEDKLLSEDPTNQVTYDAFTQWRSEGNAVLAQIDSLFKTDYEKNFLLLTENKRSEFQSLRSKIRDGTVVLRTIHSTINNY